MTEETILTGVVKETRLGPPGAIKVVPKSSSLLKQLISRLAGNHKLVMCPEKYSEGDNFERHVQPCPIPGVDYMVVGGDVDED